MINKVLVISNLYPSQKDPFYGTFVKNFVEDLSNSNNIQDIETCVIKGRSYTLYDKIWKYTLFYIKIVYLLLCEKYDIVYVHIITHAALPLRFVSLFKKLPLIFNIHGEDLLTQTRLASFFLSIVKPLLFQAKMIVVPSLFFKEKVQEIFPKIPNSQLFVSASGGINDNFFHNHKNQSNDIPIIGYVSRIDRGKGWDIFIQALHLLKIRGINFNAQIIGRGEETNQMKDLISSLNLNEYVNYIGPIEYKELPRFYSQFDIFVFPTQLEESLGLVGLEAMACKVPVIGAKIGGLTDYINNDSNGYFFTPSDANDLAEKISQYLSLSKEQQSKMKAEAYHTALNYRSTTVSEKLISKILS